MVIFARLLPAAALSLIFAITPAFAELPKYVEGEAIVMLRTDASSSGATPLSSLGASKTAAADAASEFGAVVVQSFLPVEASELAFEDTGDDVASRTLSVNDTPSASGGTYAVAHLRSAENESTEAFIARLRNDSRVVSAMPNYIMRLSSEETEAAAPNDPLYVYQWGLKRINAAEVWAATAEAESEEVVVAVIDSGILYDHEDLAENMYEFNKATLSRMGVDGVDPNEFDGSHGAWFHSSNVTIDNESGEESGTPFDPIPIGPGDDTVSVTYDDVMSVTENSRYVGDTSGHGTHVAGIIGAVTNNKIGIAGIAQNVKLMAVAVFSYYYDGTEEKYVSGGVLSDILRGIDFTIAAKNAGVNVRVANISICGWGYPEDADVTPYSAKIKALSDAGIILCIAAGNDSQDLDNPSGDNEGQIERPAMFRFENTIAVGASTEEDERASFSNYSSSGSWVDVFAPGNNIVSAVRTTSIDDKLEVMYNEMGYYSASGTSMATPHITGVAALLCSLFPDMSASEIKQLILDGANGDVLKDSNSAYGLINAYESWRIGTKRAASGSGGGCNAGAGAAALLLFPVFFALRRAFKKER